MHLPALRQGCRAFPLLCKPLARCSGEWGASEGSQCKAGNTKERHGTHSTLQRLLPQIDARLEAYLPALARGDNEEDQGAPGGARAEQLHATIEALKQRQSLEQACQKQWMRAVS